MLTAILVTMFVLLVTALIVASMLGKIRVTIILATVVVAVGVAGIIWSLVHIWGMALAGEI
jgi:hypothetical protein